MHLPRGMFNSRPYSDVRNKKKNIVVFQIRMYNYESDMLFSEEQ